jgi:transposase
VARIIDPSSKLATVRGLNEETSLSSLGDILGLGAVREPEAYRAMDWLEGRQEAIETQLARKHLSDGSLVLYDLTSAYFEGRCCPLAHLGYPRDRKKGKLQIVFGLLCNAEGCPVAVEVFDGNTADPSTLSSQINKLRDRFGFTRIIVVGDRGMITDARIREDLQGTDYDWITALRAPAIKNLVQDGDIQLSLFDEMDLGEIQSPDYPDERLIVCKNPFLAKERARKRQDLIRSTQAQLNKIVEATKRPKRALKGEKKIAVRVDKVINRFKVAKYFTPEITETSFSYTHNEPRINEDAELDGFYVIRTSVCAKNMSPEEVVDVYKSLSRVERAFRCIKTVDLKVRPFHHHLEGRVRAHVFICMLAYYVEWHMRQKLAPLLFDDDDKAAARALRHSVVVPAQRSAKALKKAQSKRTEDDFPVSSFNGLLANLSTITRNLIEPNLPGIDSFYQTTDPTPLQLRALDLLGVKI